MIERSKQDRYKCKKCGTAYPTKEDAHECEVFHKTHGALY